MVKLDVVISLRTPITEKLIFGTIVVYFYIVKKRGQARLFWDRKCEARKSLQRVLYSMWKTGMCRHARVCVCVRACVCICVRSCIRACMHACMYACMHVCMYVVLPTYAAMHDEV